MGSWWEGEPLGGWGTTWGEGSDVVTAGKGVGRSVLGVGSAAEPLDNPGKAD